VRCKRVAEKSDVELSWSLKAFKRGVALASAVSGLNTGATKFTGSPTKPNHLTKLHAGVAHTAVLHTGANAFSTTYDACDRQKCSSIKIESILLGPHGRPIG
jgi:hypothetical protein